MPPDYAAFWPDYQAVQGLSQAAGVRSRSYSQAAFYPAPRRQLAPPDVPRPLRVIHVGQYMVRAGIEVWLKSLIRQADPRRVTFPRCIATSPLSDMRVIQEMPVPVEVGGERTVRRAAEDCDVLLISGPAEVADWLGPDRPLCVLVAHSETVWSRMILDRCAGKVDHVVAVSNGVQQQVCNGFPSSVIYNGCDTAHLARTVPRDEFRARFGLTPDDFVVGSVMRLTPGKNPELLIEAIARLPRRYKLFLVGWGALQQKLLYLANEIAPMRCIIAAAEENLGDYYAAFDAFCLPSDSEGFGLASLEALFSGVPVVTTRTGFPPELLTSGVHYLQCASQPESIARALVRLRKHPQWAAGIAAEGRRAAERFGFASRMCRQYEDLLIRLWNERAGGRTAGNGHAHAGNGTGGNGACRDHSAAETANGSAARSSKTCDGATCGDEASPRDRLASEACSGNGECG